MSDPSLGTWLRRERERRGVSLRSIAEQTKVAFPLLEALEADDLSRWPGGIYRRAFVRSYATAVGLDPDEVVQRFEREHGPGEAADPAAPPAPPGAPSPSSERAESAVTAPAPARRAASLSMRARAFGTLADLTVALVLGMGAAAAGSRLLWPVLLIAAYYAAGVLFTGTSPMVALLDRDHAEPEVARIAPPREAAPARPQPARTHQQRRGPRAVRSTRAPRPRVQ